jgi:ribosomal protein S18 acetylase RimI-like enzyme
VSVALRDADVETAHTLFREYADGLGVDLTFQDFERELAELPGNYDRILVAEVGGETAGCVGVRPLDEGVCEMKRLYVRDAYRGLGIGRILAQSAIDAARELGYHRMRLDTLPSMQEAMALYEALGFRDVEPYRFNPIAGSRFLELVLVSRSGP